MAARECVRSRMPPGCATRTKAPRGVYAGRSWLRKQPTRPNRASSRWPVTICVNRCMRWDCSWMLCRSRSLAARERRNSWTTFAARWMPSRSLFDALMDISRLEAGGVKPRVERFGLGESVRAAAHRVRAHRPPEGTGTARDPHDVRHAQRSSVAGAHPAQFRFQCRPLYLARRSAARLPPQRRSLAHRGLGYRARHTRRQAARGVSRIRPTRRCDPDGPGGQWQRYGDGRQAGSGDGTRARDRGAAGGLLDHPLRLRSTHGRGSVFAITVPRVQSHAREQRRAAAPEVPAAFELAGLAVLLIDPDPTTRAILKSWLLRWNCEVTTAQSAADVHALLTASQRVPCLIITRCSAPPVAADAIGGNVMAATGPANQAGVAPRRRAQRWRARSIWSICCVRNSTRRSRPCCWPTSRGLIAPCARIGQAGCAARAAAPTRGSGRLRALVLDLLRVDAATEHSLRRPDASIASGLIGRRGNC